MPVLCSPGIRHGSEGQITSFGHQRIDLLTEPFTWYPKEPFSAYNGPQGHQ